MPGKTKQRPEVIFFDQLLKAGVSLWESAPSSGAVAGFAQEQEAVP